MEGSLGDIYATHTSPRPHREAGQSELINKTWKHWMAYVCVCVCVCVCRFGGVRGQQTKVDKKNINSGQVGREEGREHKE